MLWLLTELITWPLLKNRGHFTLLFHCPSEMRWQLRSESPLTCPETSPLWGVTKTWGKPVRILARIKNHTRTLPNQASTGWVLHRLVTILLTVCHSVSFLFFLLFHLITYQSTDGIATNRSSLCFLLVLRFLLLWSLCYSPTKLPYTVTQKSDSMFGTF